MTKQHTPEEIERLNKLNAPPINRWEIKSEPVLPITYFYGKLPEDTSVDHQECIDWLLTNRKKFEDGEVIPIPSEIDCFQHLMVEIDNLIANITLGQLEIESIWGQVAEKNEALGYRSNRLALIPPNIYDLSFIYYLQASEDHGSLVFPNQFQNLDIPKEVFPSTGGIVLFPAFMAHYVNKNTHDSPRIVVTGNYRQRNFKEMQEGVENVYKNLQQG